MMIRDGSPPPRIRLFRSDFLERFTFITPRAFALTWAVVLAVAFHAGWGTAGVSASIGLVLLGLLIWTLFEYGMHRFIFHLNLRSKFGQWLVYLTHGNHHVAPGDPYRNIMPPIVSLAILGAFWAAFLAVLGPSGSVLFWGFAIGYIVYDVVHYACHQFPMRAPVLKQIKKHHIRHHYAKRDGNYAITAIFWDRVFRTQVNRETR